MPLVRLEINERAFNRQFKEIWKDESFFQILVGSGGSGKSENAAAKRLFRLLLEDDIRSYGVRKVGKTIRVSQWKLLKDQIKRWGMQKLFRMHETEMVLTCFNGNTWQALGLDDREKIKSLTSPTEFWIEEGTEIEENDFDQLTTRIRGYTGGYPQITTSFNPIDEEHWLRRRFFPEEVWEQVVKNKFHHTTEKIKVDKTTVEVSTLLCHSTFEDNKFLSDEDKARLLMHKDRNPQHYRVYALGQWGRTEGLVYPKGYIMIDKSEYPKAEDCEVVYGLDFGFTNPTSLSRYYLKTKIENGLPVLQSFREQLIYESKLEIGDLIAKMKSFGIHPADPIYCDHQAAEKMRQLEEVEEDGQILFNIVPANKEVFQGIEYLRTVERYSNPENVEANREIKMYRLKPRVDGRGYQDGEPIKYLDHAMDEERYALYTHSLKEELLMAFI